MMPLLLINRWRTEAKIATSRVPSPPNFALCHEIRLHVWLRFVILVNELRENFPCPLLYNYLKWRGVYRFIGIVPDEWWFYFSVNTLYSVMVECQQLHPDPEMNEADDESDDEGNPPFSRPDDEQGSSCWSFLKIFHRNPDYLIYFIFNI